MSVLQFLGLTSGDKRLLPWPVYASVGALCAVVGVAGLLADLATWATVLLALGALVMAALAAVAWRGQRSGSPGRRPGARS